MLSLTFKAIHNTYQDVLASKRSRARAGLGPEDVRWLGVIAQLASE